MAETSTLDEPITLDQTVAIDELLDRVRAALPDRPRPWELPAIIAGGGLVIDTRPASLRDRDGSLPGALIVERNVLEWRLDPTSPNRLPEVRDADQVIVVVCDEGYASSLAARSLQELGLHRATDLDGGYQAWRRHRRDQELRALAERSAAGR